MKLMTKEIEKAAREQHVRYATSSLSELQIVAKFLALCGSWTWYLITQDPDDADYTCGE